MAIIVSACLLGRNCKYNGGNNYKETIVEKLKDKDVIEVCPECAAGLSIPRIPMELINGMAVDKEGNPHPEMEIGIQKTFELFKGKAIEYAILQSRSPSCGVKQVYDGTFSGRKIEGQGLFTKALRKAGITCIDVEDI
ncbi:MAG: DUF523 domain-containing protein [Erysipelotrichaceae bacterium]|nr:DUF523 domain-containing protein [Erysipelotrichaceae bacterium]